MENKEKMNTVGWYCHQCRRTVTKQHDHLAEPVATTCMDCDGRGYIPGEEHGADYTCQRCEGSDCLNPDDCGSNGLPSSLCKNCGEAFRRDMDGDDIDYPPGAIISMAASVIIGLQVCPGSKYAQQDAVDWLSCRYFAPCSICRKRHRSDDRHPCE